MMKTIFKLSLLALTLLPLSAQAELMSTTNDTNGTFTSKLMACSNIIGERGILRPHQTVTATEAEMNQFRMVCGNACSIDMYASTSCGGDIVATVKVTKKDGIVEVINHNVKGYQIQASGYKTLITGGSAKKWYQFWI